MCADVETTLSGNTPVAVHAACIWLPRPEDGEYAVDSFFTGQRRIPLTAYRCTQPAPRRGRRFVAAALLFLGLTPRPALAQAGAADAATLDLYKAKCQICHMVDGNSPIQPMNLADGVWLHGDKIADHAKAIADGVPGKAMRAFKDELTKEQVLALAKYVHSFDKKAAASKGGK
jgi:mono/diheme cytochrome c family protein